VLVQEAGRADVNVRGTPPGESGDVQTCSTSFEGRVARRRGERLVRRNRVHDSGSGLT
jgi:hypothetical protein